MNFENQGKPIAIIKTDKSKKTPIICIDDKKNSYHSFNEFILDDSDYFQQIPDPTTERSILYVTGSSGSGKSTYIYNYCMQFKKMFPKREIYLFSSLSDDGSIDKIKGLKRIKLSPELLEEEITAEDFENSLVIFDDCDCITDKKMKSKVQSIQNSILETGRHFKVYCCISSHLPCAGNETKRTLNEAHSITFFPHSLGGRSLKYLLEGYLGLDKHQIEKIKKINSRWVTVIKSYPKIIMGEKDIYCLINN
jgi:Cdc6-like AAA superfamily ATPase